jgi:hypothetical protein
VKRSTKIFRLHLNTSVIFKKDRVNCNGKKFFVLSETVDMSKVKQRLFLVSMLLIYVGIAVGGFVVAYIVKHDFFSSNTTVILTPTPSKVKQVQSPASWKTYTNTDDKLTFSYPPTDNIKTSSLGFGVTSIALVTVNGDADFQILLLPKALAQTVGQNFDGYYAMPDNTTKVIKSPLSQDNTTEQFTKIRNRTVNGLQALDYQSLASNAPAGSQPEIGTFIVAGGNLILFSTEKSNKTELEEMLSSFTYSP